MTQNREERINVDSIMPKLNTALGLVGAVIEFGLPSNAKAPDTSTLENRMELHSIAHRAIKAVPSCEAIELILEDVLNALENLGKSYERAWKERELLIKHCGEAEASRALGKI